MSDWKIFFECSNGHRFGVEMECPTCDEIVAQHLHNDPPFLPPRRLSWWGVFKAWRAARRFRPDDVDWTAPHEDAPDA